MNETVYMIEIEQVLEDWSAGEIDLEEAHDELARLGHDPSEACEMLKSHDPDTFREQDEKYQAGLAGMA